MRVRRELEAQLNLVFDCGLRPTHVHSRQHIHMSPTIFAIVEELLPRYGITRLRYSRETAPVSSIVDLVQRGRHITWLASAAAVAK